MPITTCLASREEQQRPMPADRIVPAPVGILTNAITIDTPPEQVWPWLVQLGAGRAGWYSYDRVDNGGQPSADRILPEYQHIAAGDIVPAVPGATEAFVVDSVQAPRHLVLTVPRPEGGSRVSWEYLLEGRDRDRTRLIVRGRVSPEWLAPPDPLPRRAPLFIERVYRILAGIPPPVLLLIARLGHRIMLARHLRGIKRRAEGGPECVKAWSPFDPVVVEPVTAPEAGLALPRDDGPRCVEGAPGRQLLRQVEDVTTVLEACFGGQADRVLLYAENLTENFFDLSSGEAGAILQKFRVYGIRLAVVCSPGTRFSRMFGEMVAEEKRRPHFRLFDERASAREWLCRA